MASFSCSGSAVSQATVSRYLAAAGRRPVQSWRTFLRNQASAFGRYSEERSRQYARLHVPSCWAKLVQSPAAKISMVCVGLWRGLGQQQPVLNARRISLRSTQCERAATHRVRRLTAVSGGLRKACSNRFSICVGVRSPPYEARASPTPRSHATKDVAFSRGPGFEKAQLPRTGRGIHFIEQSRRAFAAAGARGRGRFERAAKVG